MKKAIALLWLVWKKRKDIMTAIQEGLDVVGVTKEGFSDGKLDVQEGQNISKESAEFFTSLYKLLGGE